MMMIYQGQRKNNGITDSHNMTIAEDCNTKLQICSTHLSDQLTLSYEHMYVSAVMNRDFDFSSVKL